MSARPTIAEVIVVEGRADVTAVKRAVDAEVLTTGGFGFQGDAMAKIIAAHRRSGIIVLTDPDSAGERIRRQIVAAVGDCKHAHLPSHLCQGARNVGVENATPPAIRDALAQARATERATVARFDVGDLLAHGLTGVAGAASRRAWLAERLGLGGADAKQLLRRLNHYGVTRAEFDDAVREMDALDL